MVNSIQQEITKTMYAILIDWLIEIGTISDHTLCLSIHILDEYLQTAVIARSHFQLVGCACLLIAAKLEEIQFPSIDDLVTVACNCFTPEEMILMEQKILRTLNYDISRPTRSYFLERYLLVSRVDCVDLQGKKKFRPALFSTPPPSSFPAPWARNNPSPAPSALTDEEFSSNYFSEISSSHSDPTIHSSQSGSLSTPTKPSHPEAVNSLDDIDLTSAESHSQFHLLSPYLPHTSSFTHHAPQHGFVPTNSRFLREESFARMLLHLTLQVYSHLLYLLTFSKDYSFNQYPMSKIAAAIVHLTKQHHRPQSEPLWSRTMQYYTNYTEEELMPIIQHLSHAHHTLLSSKYRSIFNKFDTRSHKFCCTSVLALPVSKLRYDHQHSNTSRQSQMKDCGHSPGHLFHGKNTTPKKTPLHKIQQPSRSINH